MKSKQELINLYSSNNELDLVSTQRLIEELAIRNDEILVILRGKETHLYSLVSTPEFLNLCNKINEV